MALYASNGENNDIKRGVQVTNLNPRGDVTVLRDGKEARLDKNEWIRIEDFFKKFVLGH